MSTKKAPAKKTVKKATKKPAGKKAPAKKKVATKAKAVAKKATPKKTSVKKAATKKPAAKRKSTAIKKPVKDLVFASDQESFWVQNGEILNSLLAFKDALDEMEKDVYEFHAAGDQNDFSIWVESVLCDADCAADLTKAKTPKSAKTAVVRHLKLYSI